MTYQKPYFAPKPPRYQENPRGRPPVHYRTKCTQQYAYASYTNKQNKHHKVLRVRGSDISAHKNPYPSRPSYFNYRIYAGAAVGTKPALNSYKTKRYLAPPLIVASNHDLSVPEKVKQAPDPNRVRRMRRKR